MTNVRGQHYVWRYYLQSWADSSGVLYCLRNNKLFPVQPKDIAKERDFYRLKNLTTEDIDFIERFAILSAPKHLQKSHRKLLELLTLVTEVSDIALKESPDNNELRNELNVLVNNTEELLHARIERIGKKYIDALRRGDATFFPNDPGLAGFMHFLCVQHFRTKKIKTKVIKSLSAFHTPEKVSRIWNILSHIFSANVSWCLYVERKEYQLILLQNNTGEPLITSDQPTLNLHAHVDNKSNEKLSFYYPLGPWQAIILLEEPPRTTPVIHKILSNSDVEYYNALMAKNSNEMIYSLSRSQLETGSTLNEINNKDNSDKVY